MNITEKIINSNKITKQAIQEKVSAYGSPIDLNDFNWCDKTRVFSSELNTLNIDFSLLDHVTAIISDNCQIYVGSNCTVLAGKNNEINAHHFCTVTTGSHCIVKVSGCCFVATGSFCKISSSFSAHIVSGDNCDISAEDLSSVTAFHDCKIKLEDNCIVNIRGRGMIELGTDCTAMVGSECCIESFGRLFLIRQDTRETFSFKNPGKFKTNPLEIKGYTPMAIS